MDAIVGLWQLFHSNDVFAYVCVCVCVRMEVDGEAPFVSINSNF